MTEARYRPDPKSEIIEDPNPMLLGPRKLLELRVIEHLEEAYPYWVADPSRIPDNLVIEMHALTQHKILADSDPDVSLQWSPGAIGKIKLPVKINMDLRPGEWRLVLITKDVKTGGMLP